MAYFDISGRNRELPEIPDPISVIIRDDPENLRVREILVSKGDADYQKALDWFMFINGFGRVKNIVTLG